MKIRDHKEVDLDSQMDHPTVDSVAAAVTLLHGDTEEAVVVVVDHSTVVEVDSVGSLQ
jgi:hypothetical protein